MTGLEIFLFIFIVIQTFMSAFLFIRITKNSTNKEFQYAEDIEKLEEANNSLYEFISQLSENLSIGRQYLNNLDAKGYFVADDEIGYFFEQMKTVQEDLDKFIITEISDAEELQEIQQE
jgi:cell division protein FtsB